MLGMATTATYPVPGYQPVHETSQVLSPSPLRDESATRQEPTCYTPGHESVYEQSLQRSTSTLPSENGVEGEQAPARSISTPTPLQRDSKQHQLWNRTGRLHRGRVAGDPNARTVRFDCQNMEDLLSNLQAYVANPTEPAEHATLEFTFPLAAAFLVTNPFTKKGPVVKLAMGLLQDDNSKTIYSVMEAMQPTPDSRDDFYKQRAIARACSQAIERVDGYRYSFHNTWLSKEDQAHRFSYYCNDSILNKGRAANGGAGTIGKKVLKPVYDCKGLLAMKFSIVKQNLIVEYKHIRLHETFDDRAPFPRRESKRRRFLELYNPEALQKAREKRRKVVDPDAPRKRGPYKKRALTAPSANEDEDDEPVENLQDLLGLDSSGTGHMKRKVKVPKRPKCTMCRSKKVLCDGGQPCSECSERPSFCAYTGKAPSTDNSGLAVGNETPITADDDPTSTTLTNTNGNPVTIDGDTTSTAVTGASETPINVESNMANAGSVRKARKPRLPRKSKNDTPEPTAVEKELGNAMSEMDTLRAQMAEFDRLRTQMYETEQRVRRLEWERRKEETAAKEAARPQITWNVMNQTNFANLQRQRQSKAKAAT